MKRDSSDLKIDTNLPSSAVSTTLFTPSSNADDVGLFMSHNPPSAQKSYVIKKKGTNQAITLTHEGLRLQEVQCPTDGCVRWLCVERGTHFGFCNERKKTFMGHDGKGNMRATVPWLLDHELLSPSYREAQGGFELQTPHWFLWKRVVDVAEDGSRLIRVERESPALWVFEQCE